MKRNHFLGLLVVAAAAWWLASATPAIAQNKNSAKSSSDSKYNPPALHKGASGPAPHAADGHVDLSGMWIERYAAVGPDTAAGNPPPQGRAEANAASRYPSDTLPYQPWAAAKAR